MNRPDQRPAEPDVSRLLDNPFDRRTLLRGTAALGATVLAGGLAACGGSSSSGGTSGGGGSQPSRVAKLSITDMQATDTLDPAVTLDGNATVYLLQLYDTLTASNAAYDVQPRMASSWDQNSKLTKFTFHLRPGIKFHDGSPMTAQDVVFSMSRQLDPKIGAFLNPVLTPILDPDGVVATNDKTVTFNLKQPYAPLPYLLSILTMGIAKAGTTSFTKEANGTGPFKLNSWQPGQSWSMTRNKNYWNSPLPYLAGLEAVVAPDPTAKVQEVITGAADLTDTIDFSQAALVKQSSAAALGVVPGSRWIYFAVDTTKAPFDNNDVRMALKLAMDRQAISNIVFDNQAVVGNDTAAPANSPYYPQNWPTETQQIAKAKQLLSQAGHSGGLDFTLHTSDVAGGLVDYAVAYAHNVAPAGINVTVHQDPAATFWTNVWTKEPAVVAYFTPAFHPAAMLSLNYVPGALYNDTHQGASPITSLVSQAVATANLAQQKALYGQAFKWIGENGGNISPGWANFIYAKNGQLIGDQFVRGGYVLDKARFTG